VTDVLLDRIAGTSERATAEAARATAEADRATAEAERRRAALRRSFLRTLHLRGLDVTDAQRALVERCADADQLERWDERVVDVASAAALFDADP